MTASSLRRTTNQFLAFLVVGHAQHTNLIAALLVVQEGEGQRKEHVDSFDGVLTPAWNLRFLRYWKDWLLF